MGDQASRDSGVRAASLVQVAIGFGVVGGLLWAGSGVWFLVRFLWLDAPVGNIVPGVFVRAIGFTCPFMLAELWAVSRVAATRPGRGARYGVAVCALGFLLVLPATVIPSGALSPPGPR